MSLAHCFSPSLQAYLQDGLLARVRKILGVIVKKRAITVRLPLDLVRELENEAIEDGQNRQSGRVYSPSSTLERILREYFAAKPERRRKRSK